MKFGIIKKTPNLKYLKVWGCLAKVKILENKIKKIGPKAVDAIFIGYATNSNANRFLVFNSQVNEIDNNTIIEARDAIYFENIFSFKIRINNQINTNNDPNASSSRTRLREEEEGIEPRRSKRTRVEKNFGEDFFTFLIEDSPTSFEDAMKSLDAPFWKEAINNEMKSIV